MRSRNIFAVVHKDLIEVRQNRYAWLPMIIVPLLFVVILPLIFTLIVPRLSIEVGDLSSQEDFELLLRAMPQDVRQNLLSLSPMQLMIEMILGYYFAPMFLIMPLMFSTTIAAESFAGERERKTIETLLYTPATDLELFLGKVLAAVIPAITITWVSFILYAVVLNVVPYHLFKCIWFPLTSWWPLIFWVTPASVAFGIVITVLISSKVHTFLGAYQTSSSVVLLVVLLFMGQVSGIIYLSVGLTFLIGLGIWLIAGLLGYHAVRTFNRQKLLIE